MGKRGHAAGLDVGGTKIAAQLFDDLWTIIEEREVPTPCDNYASLLNAIVGEIDWLRSVSGGRQVPIGIGLPGIIDSQNGTVLTANLPATGRTLWRDLEAQLSGVGPVIVNDCRAFALSEARLGAGRDQDVVVGLVIGTGLAGGMVYRGNLIEGSSGAAGEFGHIPIAAHLLQRHELPILPCGCGRTACYETLCSGTGLLHIVKHVTGQDIDSTAFAKNPDQNPQELNRCLAIWIDLLSELMTTICLSFNPACVVLGGGASQVPDLIPGLTGALDKKLLAGMTSPTICLAQGGPRSGARGAALAAAMARKTS